MYGFPPNLYGYGGLGLMNQGLGLGQGLGLNQQSPLAGGAQNSIPKTGNKLGDALVALAGIVEQVGNVAISAAYMRNNPYAGAFGGAGGFNPYAQYGGAGLYGGTGGLYGGAAFPGAGALYGGAGLGSSWNGFATPLV